MDAAPVDKDAVAADLAQQKTLFHRSLAPRHDLPAGHVLDESDLTVKKPGTGIPWSDREQILGRRLIHSVPLNRLLRFEDFA